MVKTYQFTPEERHRMLLEIAFYLLPIDLSGSLSFLSEHSGIAQSRFKQLIKEAVEENVMCCRQIAECRYTKTLYELSVVKKFELLREIRRNPEGFVGRTTYRYRYQQKIQKFIAEGTMSKLLVTDVDVHQLTPYLMWMPFFEEFRPYFDFQDPELQEACFRDLFEEGFLYNLPNGFDLEAAYLNNPAIQLSALESIFRIVYSKLYVLSGRMGEIPLSFLSHKTPEAFKILGVKALYNGFYDSAVDHFRNALKMDRAKVFPELLYNMFYVMALAREGSETSMSVLNELSRLNQLRSQFHLRPLITLVEMLRNATKPSWFPVDFDYLIASLQPVDKALFLILARHYKFPNAEFPNDVLTSLIDGPCFRLFQLEASVDFPEFQSRAEELKQAVGYEPLLKVFRQKAEWESVLDRLLDGGVVDGKQQQRLTPVSTSRIIYRVNPQAEITPVLQKSKDGVNWTGGRHIAVKTFQGGIPEMSDFDRKMVSYIRRYTDGYGPDRYVLGGAAAIGALAGYPLVFAESSPSTPVVISKNRLELSVRKTPAGYVLEDNVGNVSRYSRCMLIVETDFLYHVVELTPQQCEMLPLLHKVKVFPEESLPRLTQLLEALSKTITIHSDLIEAGHDAELIEADTRLTVQLQPLGDGIKAASYVKPLPGNPPYCRPGVGNVSVLGTIEGRNVRTERDLKMEKKHLSQLNEWIADVIYMADTSNGDYLYMDTPEICLTLLETLQAHQEEVFVEWPQGARYNLRGRIDFNNITLSGQSVGQWFELEGTVSIDDNHVMTIGELLRSLRDAHGRFVQLSNGEFIALSDKLRSQLATLEAITRSDKKMDRIPAIAAGFLAAFEQEGSVVKKDKALKLLQQRIAEADSRDYPVPDGIQAELREYQVAGYQWMARLTAWGAGACLADDMGLGKTLQTITLLLARAAEGPSLVVTPTSVSLNWLSEIQRFAPSLNPVLLSGLPAERHKAIELAKPFDVLLTSYGVMSNDIELLSAREWNVVALDEAHTIKNKETRMSKSAMVLRARARVLLTGTPLQNDLSELWNLFQFANPGLLGDFAAFTSKFLNPIEKQDDQDRRRLLKHLVRPFILRRTKTEVLDELPEKTEITLRVELSADERALYENLRREAIAQMSGSDGNAIQALAEITKLRQAACHPALVNPDLNISSSKTAAFLNMVDELVHNRHRALVFSQFTSHLTLIREALDKYGIEYLYLDGSTPSGARNKLVQQFQEGNIPLFLISLKAGGLGLNLTAADYVIHLDPWWNPAIEDQASDRAYRMGQTRPVTVYRLIAAGTIEEKIIRLHQTKKALADSLLEGSNRIQKISAAEILELLTEK